MRSLSLKFCHVALYLVSVLPCILLCHVTLYIFSYQFFQRRNHNTPESEQEELNDIQIRCPSANRCSRSSLNAIGNTNNSKSNNTMTVTTAIVTLPTPSTASETESSKTQTASGTQFSNPVRISTL